MDKENDIKIEEQKKTPKRKITKKDVTPTLEKKKTVKKVKKTELEVPLIIEEKSIIEEKVEISPLLKEETPEVITVEKEKTQFPFVNISHEFKTAEVLFLIIIAMLIGTCLGGLTIGLNSKPKIVNTTIDASKDTKFSKIIKTYNEMNSKYMDGVSSDELINGAIKGMLSTVEDPYTSYFDEQETTTFYKRLKGVFLGIGCVVASDTKNAYVTSVLENSPASRAGIKDWDKIISINGVSAIGLTSAEVVNIIETSKTNDIIIKIERDKEVKDYKLIKDIVVINSVKSKTYNVNNKKIGYITIDIFAQNTYTQFKKELEALEKSGISSLIIDVRDNSGGYLAVVEEIASMFLTKDQVIYQLKTKDAISQIKSTAIVNRKYPVVILQNENSASGSEVLAGAMKEIYKATIIGTNSYGKSSVQQTSDLGDGTMIKYTVQKWLTSLGNDVGKVGLEPTIKVEQKEIYYTNPTDENDAQLQSALSTLSK